MPFQVSYSSKATPVGVINFFSAGEDQVTICDVSVTLTAIIVGDLTGHSIIWEQLTGVPVTFTTPLNQLSVSFTTATFEDKSFRFTIDKGQGGEQFDDINIFGTPTFKYYSGTPDHNCIINYGSALRCNAPNISVLDAFPVPANGAVECVVSSSQALYWAVPCEANLLVQYVVQERSVAGPWTDEAILPASTQNYTPLNVGSTYRVVAVRREINSAISSVPSNSLYVDGTIGTSNNPNKTGVAATDSVVGASPAKIDTMSIPTYSTTLLTLTTCPPDAPDDYYSGGPSKIDTMTIPTFTVDVLSLLFCDPNVPDDYYSGGPAGIQSMIVPTYTVLDLSGGDIGG